MLCHFAIAVLLIAIVSTMPLVGTLAAVYVDVGGMTTIHPNALADSSILGCFCCVAKHFWKLCLPRRMKYHPRDRKFQLPALVIPLGMLQC